MKRHTETDKHGNGLLILKYEIGLKLSFADCSICVIANHSHILKGIEKVRHYTSLCQESSLLSHKSIRRLLFPFQSSPRLKTRKVLLFV
jgi:hypothetical protein